MGWEKGYDLTTDTEVAVPEHGLYRIVPQTATATLQVKQTVTQDFQQIASISVNSYLDIRLNATLPIKVVFASGTCTIMRLREPEK